MLQQLKSFHCIKPKRLKAHLPFFDLQLETPTCGCIKHIRGFPWLVSSISPHFVSKWKGFCSPITRTCPSYSLSDQALIGFKMRNSVQLSVKICKHSQPQSEVNVRTVWLVLCKCFQRVAVISEHGSKWYWASPAGIFGKTKWTKKAFPASFPRGQNPLSFYPHLSNILAQAQNIWM